MKTIYHPGKEVIEGTQRGGKIFFFQEIERGIFYLEAKTFIPSRHDEGFN